MSDPIRTPHPTNGSVGVVLPDRPGALAYYPHLRRVGDLVFVSGLSCRRPDNSHEGVTLHPDGTVERDIAAQTRACIENLGVLLAAEGGTIHSVVDLTTFLVSMADFPSYNAVYNTYFNAATGPTRTTVAVAELPHPNLLIELKAVACIPPVPKEASP